MDKNEYTRRIFLRSAGCGIAAIALHPSGSPAGEPSRRTFTFVQLCDTQLGFGGYEHDVNTFKQAVKQINAMHTHRLLINQYKGIQLVNGETTSKNFDQRPFGFRVWHVTDRRPLEHEFASLEGF